MDNGEAMYWLAVVQQANNGDKEAMEVLRQEDGFRTETGQPTVQEELEEIAKEAEIKNALQNGKVIWERP